MGLMVQLGRSGREPGDDHADEDRRTTVSVQDSLNAAPSFAGKEPPKERVIKHVSVEPTAIDTRQAIRCRAYLDHASTMSTLLGDFSLVSVFGSSFTISGQASPKSTRRGEFVFVSAFWPKIAIPPSRRPKPSELSYPSLQRSQARKRSIHGGLSLLTSHPVPYLRVGFFKPQRRRSIVGVRSER